MLIEIDCLVAVEAGGTGCTAPRGLSFALQRTCLWRPRCFAACGGRGDPLRGARASSVLSLCGFEQVFKRGSCARCFSSV